MMFSEKTCRVLIAILLVAFMVVEGCSSASTTKRADSQSVPAKNENTYNPEKERLDRYSAWFESLGTNVALATQGVAIPDGFDGWVVGRVSNVYFAEESNGQPTFIDFSPKGYESTPFFTAIVWIEDLGNFDGFDLSSLVEKEIAVKGSVYTYEYAHKQVKLTSPSQISVCPV